MTASPNRNPITDDAAARPARPSHGRHASPEPAPGFWLVHELDTLARSQGLVPVRGRHARPDSFLPAAQAA